MELFFFTVSKETFLLIYRLSYYGGVVAVCTGLAAILIRTRCNVKELMALRYNHYYQSEISAFLLFATVAFIYINSAFVIPYLQHALEKANEYSVLTGKDIGKQNEGMVVFIKYLIKAVLEFMLVGFTVFLHKTNKVIISKFTQTILSISFLYGAWHCIRAFDVVIFETHYFDSFYGPFNILLTAIVSIIMMLYAFSITKKTYKEF